MMEQLPLTESENPSTVELDRLDTRELLRRINDEDRRVAWAVERELDVIATTVDAVAARLAKGGRLLYFGAGTSGRIAMMDAAELWPTFSFPPDRSVAHLAGGATAAWRAAEGAEDDADAGRADALAARIGSDDAIIGVSASGQAMYVRAALQAAKDAGALTIALTNSPRTPLEAVAHITIALLTGPEVIAGSTRMKAGSAQKMALNAISTAVMVKLGKTYGNLMVDIRPTSEKLRRRAVRLTASLSNAPTERALAVLEATGFRVPVAVVMLARGVDAREAEELIASAGGRLRAALQSSPP